MSNKKNNTIDWNIHAVYTDKEHPEPIDMHTHGLEKHGIYNICITCPSQELVDFCAGFINRLGKSMIDGEKYKCGKTQFIDSIDNELKIYDVFNIDIERRDNGEGAENVYVIDYWFDDIFIHPNNLFHYIFDHQDKCWRCLTVYEYETMSTDEYNERTKRNKW